MGNATASAIKATKLTVLTIVMVSAAIDRPASAAVPEPAPAEQQTDSDRQLPPTQPLEDVCYEATLSRAASADERCSFVIAQLSALPLLDGAQQQMLAAAYANRATSRARERDYSGAQTDLGNALKLTPDDPVLYLNRGNLFLYQGEFEAALADYQKAVAQSNGPIPAAHHNMVLAYRGLGRSVEAEAELLRARGLEVRFTPTDRARTDA